MELIFILIGIATGMAIGWLLAQKKLANTNKTFEMERSQQALYIATLEKQTGIIAETLRLKTEELDKQSSELARILEQSEFRSTENATLHAEAKHLKERLQLQKHETEELQNRLTAEFENISNKLLKQRSDEFSMVNYKAMGEVLAPLKEKIHNFEKKVEEAYDKELRDKYSLREEVKKLSELNTRISQEANNLTKALKGDVKKQGNWGEVILERVLERSGLTKGQEYQREEVIEGADKSIQRPDVIIHLPDNKHIVIDAKVSLVAYEKFATSDTEELQLQAIKEHTNSIRNHVKQLSEKNYQLAAQLNTPDFVLLFIPIEASFSVAVQADADLFSYAWERKIVIVSPTTLLATLRTISSIWKQESQTKNAQEIARLSGSLYDKFIGFTEEMAKIKLNLNRATDSYDEAVKKMKEGNGNIVRTAERIKELGAKTGIKSIPAEFL